MELTNTASDNNDGSNWTEAIARGGTFDQSGTDLGTPGAQNSVVGPAAALHVLGLTVDNIEGGATAGTDAPP